MDLRPTHAVVGTADVVRSLAFLEAFGFEAAARRRVPALVARALYGLDADTEEVDVTAGGLARGAIRLVRTPHGAGPHGVLEAGPHAIDVYSRNADASATVGAAAGGDCGPIGRYRLGPLSVAELEVIGPDHLALVVIDVDRRRPCLLDLNPERLHSEVHAVVWTVADVSASLPFWQERAGFALWIDTTVREPEIAKFMRLPRPDMALRLAVLAGPDGGAPRFELVGFPDDAVAMRPQHAALEAGLHALGCDTADIEATVGGLPEVSWGSIVDLDDGGRAVAGRAPGGVRIELRTAVPE